MSAVERLKVLAEVERQGSWEGTERTERPWNRLRPDEAAVVLVAAHSLPRRGSVKLYRGYLFGR